MKGAGLSPLAVCLLALIPACAQEFRGTILGQVTDQAGSVIPGARVIITNLETWQSIRLFANERGNYLAPLLQVGPYRLEVDYPGFRRYVRDPVEVRVNDRLQVDVTLELGEVTQMVEIVSGALVIEAADSSLGQVVDSRRVAELPIAHGNPYQLIALAPGTSFDGDAKLNRPYEPTHIVSYAISGTRAGASDITLDGVANTALGSNGAVSAAYVPPADAVAEFRVQTAPFDAKVGQGSGGVVNISLKAGANHLRGSAYYTKMAPEMMANDFFANRAGLTSASFTYNRWGGSLAGPAMLPRLRDPDNRTFFLWAYEGLTDTRPRAPDGAITVPTPRQRAGDFSELLALGSQYQVYNPFTRRAVPGGHYQADPFPGNLLPPSLIDGVARRVLDYVPLPNDAGTTADHMNNYPAAGSEPENTRYYNHVGRLDRGFSDSHRFFLRANVYKRKSLAKDYFHSRATGQDQQFLSRGASADDVYLIAPSLVVNLRYGYNRYVRQTKPKYGRGLDLTTLGFPDYLNNWISPDVREFPVFAVSGMFSTNNIGEDRNVDTHSFVAAFTKGSGSHSLEFGHEFRAYRHNRYVISSAQSGFYSFDDTYTRGPLENSPAGPAGQAFAGFLLGLPEPKKSLIARNTSFAEQSTAWMFYVQDRWRVTRKLNLTLGLRYELEGPMTERYNRSVRGFDPGALLPQSDAARAAYAEVYAGAPTPELPPERFALRGGLTFAGVGGQPRTLWERIGTNFMPRIGFAYSIGDKAVLRSGYGLFFAPLGVRRGDVCQNGFSRSTAMIATLNNLDFTASLSDPFPGGIVEPLGAAGGILTDIGNNISFFNTRPRAPYMQRWQVSIQREILRGTVLEAGYVGNRGTRIETETMGSTAVSAGVNLNPVPVQYLSRSPLRDAANIAAGNYLLASLPSPFRGLPGMGALSAAGAITRETLLKPYPQFGSMTSSDNAGYSWYHALQARIERRYAAGLTLGAAYTWSKFMEGVTYLNAGDPMPAESISGQDHKHLISLSYIYELPLGRGRRLFPVAGARLDRLIGGWQIQGIYAYQSGSPLLWLDTTRLPGAAEVPRAGRNVDRWLDTGAFLTDSALRPQRHYRTWPLRFGNIRADATNNWDLSVIKKLGITERLTAQFRGEFLNALNHPRFKAPNMDPYSKAFGQISDTSAYPRQIQAGVKVTF
jgi:hypothetical protein